jgi:hypothetical protein
VILELGVQFEVSSELLLLGMKSLGERSQRGVHPKAR